MVAVDGVVFFQVLDAAKAAYEVSDLYTRDHGALDHQPAHRDGLDGPRRDAVEARRDQCAAAGRGRPGDRGLGREDHPGRASKDIRPPAGHRQRDDPADEGRAREARRRSSRPRACASRRSSSAEGEKQAAILSAEGAREAAFREAEARERAAQAEANATKSVSDAIEGGSSQAINYFIAQKYVEAVGKFATLAQRQDDLVPGRGDAADRARSAGSASLRGKRSATAPADQCRHRASRPRRAVPESRRMNG